MCFFGKKHEGVRVLSMAGESGEQCWWWTEKIVAAAANAVVVVIDDVAVVAGAAVVCGCENPGTLFGKGVTEGPVGQQAVLPACMH